MNTCPVSNHIIKPNHSQFKPHEEVIKLSDLSNHLNVLRTFSIEPVEGNEISCSQTRILFQTMNSSSSHSWLSPEIDSLNFSEVFPIENGLFTKLLELGYSSDLIKHFSYCESNDSGFEDPQFKAVLLSRFPKKLRPEDKGKLRYVYHLKEGSKSFSRMFSLDPFFWSTICRATIEQRNVVAFTSTHLCADYEGDLMDSIGASVSLGHFEAFGMKPYAFMRVNGTEMKGQIGKRSKLYRRLKGKDIQILTLYIGSPKVNTVSGVFYDKQREMRTRHEEHVDPRTRLEIRFNTVLDNEKAKQAALILIQSYYHPEGAAIRTHYFANSLTSLIEFTTTFNKARTRKFAPWWRFEVLEPLFLACQEVSSDKYGKFAFEAINGILLDSPLVQSNPKPKRGRPKGSKDKKKRQSTSTGKSISDGVIDV